MNILPDKYCNFDCIFCPIGRSHNKVDEPQSFNNMEESLMELKNKIKDIIDKLSLDKVIIQRMNDEKFKKKLSISDERYEEICKILINS